LIQHGGGFKDSVASAAIDPVQLRNNKLLSLANYAIQSNAPEFELNISAASPSNKRECANAFEKRVR
jgi:hypothetical protein